MISRITYWTAALIALASLTVILITIDSTLTQKQQKHHSDISSQLKHPIVLGIADPYLNNETLQAQASQLATMRSIGITSIRLDANWADIQPDDPTTYLWSKLDRVIHSIRSAGMSVDLIIDGSPHWAAVPSAAHYTFAQPRSSAQYAHFAVAVVKRYAPEGIRYFEIWNEPNNQGFWRPKPNPAAYTADLVAAYAGIKKVDPSAVVLSGGLSPAADNGTNYTPATFLEQMYSHGAKGSFDIVSDHPYSYPALPNSYEPWSAWSQMDQTEPSVRGVMVANGDSDKQIWITEFGAPSFGPKGVGVNAQETQLSQALAFARTESWIGALYIYTWQDGTIIPRGSNGFGLIDEQGSQKPVFNAVASLDNRY